MGCILFEGCRTPHGYGMKWHKHRMVIASRLAYAEANGLDVFTMGGVVMHTCDNPPCGNPEHLVLGTQADNMADMAKKGRSGQYKGQPARTRGSEQTAAKLTEDICVQLVSRYVPRCRVNGARAMAREFGVGHSQVVNVINGKAWVHAGGDLSSGH